jgi:hypothetical protein
MKKLYVFAAILAFIFSAAQAVGEVRILLLIEDPSGGTFKVREQEMVSSQGRSVLKPTPVVEHGALSRFQKVYTVSGSDGYVIDIVAVSGRLENVQVSATDYAMKLAIQPRLIPGSDPPAATFSFNAVELKGCCGE